MRYERRGEVPAKRHVAVRQPTGNGSRRLLVEEVMGYEGFSGNETILYHLNSPCRLDSVGEFTPRRAQRVGTGCARAPAGRHGADRGRRRCGRAAAGS